MPLPPPSGVALMRKSYSMTVPGRGAGGHSRAGRLPAVAPEHGPVAVLLIFNHDSPRMPAPLAAEAAVGGTTAAAAALGFGRAVPRSLPVPRAGARGLTDSGTPYIATSAGTGAPGSSWGASSLRGASPPPAASPVQRPSGRTLAHNLSMGALRGSGKGGSSSPVPPRPGDFARMRSKTFR